MECFQGVVALATATMKTRFHNDVVRLLRPRETTLGRILIPTMYDLLTIGDIKLDTFIQVPDASVQCELKMPACQLCIEYGKKIPVHEIVSQVAGSAPNVAIGIAKMSKTTAVSSIMGKDATHKMALEFLAKHKVDAKYVKADPKHKSSFAAVLNFKGESTQLVAHGDVEYRLTDRAPKSEWIHVSELGGGYERLYKDLVALHKKRGTKISLNPGVVQIEERKKELLNLLKVTEVLFVNRREADQLIRNGHEEEIHQVMARLKRLGPNYVVMTDGKNGAYAFDGEQLDFAPMFPGPRVEATGAGDAFSTGFLGALMHGKPHREALAWGAVNAASVVFHIGPTAGLLSHRQICKRLKERPSYKTKEL